MTGRDPDAQRGRMGKESIVVDSNILEDLHELGYVPDTMTLLPLTPLVEVAWADGQISSSERAMILGTAATRHVEWESPAHHRLLDWMVNQPSSEFFEKSWQALRLVVERLPVEQRMTWRQELISSCSYVAEASDEIGGSGLWISDAERRVIDRLAAELTPTTTPRT